MKAARFVMSSVLGLDTWKNTRTNQRVTEWIDSAGQRGSRIATVQSTELGYPFGLLTTTTNHRVGSQRGIP